MKWQPRRPTRFSCKPPKRGMNMVAAGAKVKAVYSGALNHTSESMMFGIGTCRAVESSPRPTPVSRALAVNVVRRGVATCSQVRRVHN